MAIVPKAPAVAEAAIEYAEVGRVAFPLREDGKRARVKWGSLTPGPRHVLQVRCWWRKWPEAGIGLRTGAGLVVIDVDPRHGGEVDPAWPATRTSQTRSGGYHLFYRSAAAVRCSVSKVAPGVDVRGEGGYVVAPPSPGWRWLNDLPIAALPTLPAVCSRASVTRSGRESLPEGWRPFEVRDEVSEGGRNDYLFRMAGWLLSQGIDPITMEQMLSDYNDVACKPALDEDELALITASIARYHRPSDSRR